MSGTTTRAPSGTEAARMPTNVDAVEPADTRSSGTPTSCANSPRVRSVASFQCSQLVRPCRQSSSATCNASHAGRGGRP